MTDKKIIRKALHDAIDWQMSLADAHGRDKYGDAAREAAAKYREILRRRYGEDGRTRMEKLGEGAQTVSIYDLQKGRKK